MAKKIIPFRNNPRIVTNWHNTKTDKNVVKRPKRAYYDLSVVKKKGWLTIQFREEKKRLGGSAEREEHWFGYLEFELGSVFAKDLKMFLNEYVKGEAPEVKGKEVKENGN
jgi:hypothetical protein